jgi:hypothetical protein
VPKPRSGQLLGAGDQLDGIVPDFDRLVAAAKQIRNQRHFDTLESEADAICTRIRAAFRSRA